jgi:CheY-like chemotaxis protein
MKGKGRILVIEDHASTRLALQKFLELSGYAVVAADTVATGLAAATVSFDLVLCDLNLPDGTGWDLLETLQRERPIRAVAFSAFDGPEHTTRSRAAGFLDHIPKGTDPDELLKRIKRAINLPLPPK